MSPSRIRKNQVYDSDFLSEAEHIVLDHTFVSLVDTPTTFNDGLYLKSTTSGTEWATASGTTGSYIQSEKLAMELEMEFKATKLYYYKEFTYSDNQLTNVGVYENDTKIVQLFNKILTYTENKLIQTTLTRISDSVVLTKTFSYTDNKLVSITTT